MPAAFHPARVQWIHHWNDRLFSFATERTPEFRFENGHFVMVGLEVEDRPLLRAYSIASPNYADELEFLSIKVDDGPLTSRLRHVGPGDTVLVGRKPVGTLVLSDLHPGRNLYLLATGTGLAPFLSVIRDPCAYERYERVVLVHCVRYVADLAYREYLSGGLHEDEYLGKAFREQFLYYPTVTREPYVHTGRITDLLLSGRLSSDLGLGPPDARSDRMMICGSMTMLKDVVAILEERGFFASPSQGVAGDYVIERAFVG